MVTSLVSVTSVQLGLVLVVCILTTNAFNSYHRSYQNGHLPRCGEGRKFFNDFMKCDNSLNYCFEYRNASCVGPPNWLCVHNLNRAAGVETAETDSFIKNAGFGNTRCCGGKYQSPIDIPGGVQCKSDLPTPYYSEPNQTLVGTFENTGYYPKFFVKDEDYLTPLVLRGVPFSCSMYNNDEYVFSNIHIHSGIREAHGSAHFVQGKAYDAEFHIVHLHSTFYQPGKTDMRCASQTPLGLAVIGVFLSLTEGEPNPELNKLLSKRNLEKIKDSHVLCDFDKICNPASDGDYNGFNQHISGGDNDFCREVDDDEYGFGDDTMWGDYDFGFDRRRKRDADDSDEDDDDDENEFGDNGRRGDDRRRKRDADESDEDDDDDENESGDDDRRGDDFGSDRRRKRDADDSESRDDDDDDDNGFGDDDRRGDDRRRKRDADDSESRDDDDDDDDDGFRDDDRRGRRGDDRRRKRDADDSESREDDDDDENEVGDNDRRDDDFGFDRRRKRAAEKRRRRKLKLGGGKKKRGGKGKRKGDGERKRGGEGKGDRDGRRDRDRPDNGDSGVGNRKWVCFCRRHRYQETMLWWARRGEELRCRAKYLYGAEMEEAPKHECSQHTNGAPCGDGVVEDFALRPGLLLPRNKDYFQYFGSLTTPPCSEVVNWIVMKEPIRITQQQLDNMHLLESRREGVLISKYGDVRPIQPINGRTVVTNSC